jgi:hypothetical protein
MQSRHVVHDDQTREAFKAVNSGINNPVVSPGGMIYALQWMQSVGALKFAAFDDETEDSITKPALVTARTLSNLSMFLSLLYKYRIRYVWRHWPNIIRMYAAIAAYNMWKIDMCTKTIYFLETLYLPGICV